MDRLPPTEREREIRALRHLETDLVAILEWLVEEVDLGLQRRESLRARLRVIQEEIRELETIP